MRACTYACMHVCAYVSIRVYICTCSSACVHTCLYTHESCIHHYICLCMHIYSYMYIYIYDICIIYIIIYICTCVIHTGCTFDRPPVTGPQTSSESSDDTPTHGACAAERIPTGLTSKSSKVGVPFLFGSEKD
jgi:hypothetical protein